MMMTFPKVLLRRFSFVILVVVTFVSLALALAMTPHGGSLIWPTASLAVGLCLPTLLFHTFDGIDRLSAKRRKRAGRNEPTALKYWHDGDTSGNAWAGDAQGH